MPALPKAALADTARTDTLTLDGWAVGAVGIDAVGVLGLVLVGVLDLDLIALEHATDESAVDDHRFALGEDPAGFALVAHGMAASPKTIVNVVMPPRCRRSRRHRALHAEPATSSPATRADLVGVAVVVDRRAEELR